MNKVLLPLVFSVMALSLIVSPAFAQITITPGENVLSIEGLKKFGGGAFINKINPDTGATISTVAITLDGSFPAVLRVTGGTGIAFNPVDGKTYALLKVSDDPLSEGGLDRHLVTIDPQTGIATLVGNTDVRKIASLTFDSGTLYTVNISDEALNTISTVDGSVDHLCDLFISFGTGLAFNPDDGLLYYATFNEFQRIDDFNVAGSCDVTFMVTNFENPTALVFFNSFLISEFEKELFSLTTTGIDAFIGFMDHDPRGLTVVIPGSVIIGGELIPLDTTALLLAGVQSISMWMIPVVLSGIGIGIFVIKRRK